MYPQPHTHSSLGYNLKPTTVKWSICRKKWWVSKACFKRRATVCCAKLARL